MIAEITANINVIAENICVACVLITGIYFAYKLLKDEDD